jgi:hypothetical protein
MLKLALLGFAVILFAGIAFFALLSAGRQGAVSTPSDAAPDAAPEADAGDPNATYAAGDAVDIFWGSSWWPGSIKRKDGKRYRIGYQGYGESWDEWVTATRLRPRTAR